MNETKADPTQAKLFMLAYQNMRQMFEALLEEGRKLHAENEAHRASRPLEQAVRTKHWGDCTWFSSLINGRPIDGICTCGFGWGVWTGTGDDSQLYSAERAALDAAAKQGGGARGASVSVSVAGSNDARHVGTVPMRPSSPPREDAMTPEQRVAPCVREASWFHGSARVVSERVAIECVQGAVAAEGARKDAEWRALTEQAHRQAVIDHNKLAAAESEVERLTAVTTLCCAKPAQAAAGGEAELLIKRGGKALSLICALREVLPDTPVADRIANSIIGLVDASLDARSSARAGG